MRIINYKFYIKIFLFIIFFGVVLVQLIQNKYLIINVINNNTVTILCVLFLQVFYLLTLNFRTYLLYKKFSKKILTINYWSKIFFKSLIFNISLNFTGTIYRALTLKKIGIKYSLFLGILYLLFSSYFIVNFFCIIIELFFFTKFSLYFKVIYSIFYFILIFFILYLPNILNFFFRKFLRLNRNILKIINKNNFLINFSRKNFIDSKNIISIFGLAFVLHIIEISIFILSYNIFFPNFNVETLLLLFAVSFLLDRIPFLSNIIGSSEVLFAFLSKFFGLLFYEGLLIKFIIRITGVLAIFACYCFSSLSFKK